jgi:hypothetical protein
MYLPRPGTKGGLIIYRWNQYDPSMNFSLHYNMNSWLECIEILKNSDVHPKKGVQDV